MNKCPDCGNKKSNGAVRCMECSNKLRSKSMSGSGNPNWQGGHGLKYKCNDCGKTVGNNKTKRCWECFIKSKQWFCIDCGRKVTPRATRCTGCSVEYNSIMRKATNRTSKAKKYNKCIDCGTRIGPTSVRCVTCCKVGSRNPRYIDGSTIGPFFCKFCGEEIGKYSSACVICSQRIAQKKLWNTKEHQKKMAKARNIKPNKPEKLLNNLLYELFPREYKYVGDFQFCLGGKNPDFMNINGQKKLIEFYGNYWHRNDDPQDRINHFKQYGFDTLVIWESELENMNSVINKLIEFHNI